MPTEDPARENFARAPIQILSWLHALEGASADRDSVGVASGRTGDRSFRFDVEPTSFAHDARFCVEVIHR